jgi:hypothetical protein
MNMSVQFALSVGYRQYNDEPRNVLMGLVWQIVHLVVWKICCPSQGPSPIKVFRGFAFDGLARDTTIQDVATSYEHGGISQGAANPDQSPV